MTKPCDYCGRADRNCENEAQVIGCGPFLAANEPMPRRALAEAIHATVYLAAKYRMPRVVTLSLPDARTILEALREADRRELQATIDGDMPCS